jgi:hypothetical protein
VACVGGKLWLNRERERIVREKNKTPMDPVVL